MNLSLSMEMDEVGQQEEGEEGEENLAAPVVVEDDDDKNSAEEVCAEIKAVEVDRGMEEVAVRDAKIGNADRPGLELLLGKISSVARSDPVLKLFLVTVLLISLIAASVCAGIMIGEHCERAAKHFSVNEVS